MPTHLTSNACKDTLPFCLKGKDVIRRSYPPKSHLQERKMNLKINYVYFQLGIVYEKAT